MNQKYEQKENWHEEFIIYLASQYRPKVYVELGLYQCELFNNIVPYTDVSVGVDISADAGKWMVALEKATFINSTTNQFAEALKQNPISIDMLFIDADHSKESVLKDFWNFLPFVNDQGLILLHDTHPKSKQYTDKGYCGDAYLVIDELKKHNDKFEMMTIPIHPGLTLIRKRQTQLSWENRLGFTKNSCIDDIEVLKEIQLACYSSVDIRAGWVGFGLPKTNIEEYRALSKWATEHWAMYYSFLDFVKPKIEIKVLDIGCGTGHSTFCLSELLKTDVIGIDFDPLAISFANKYNSSSFINYICEDFFEFQPNVKFDFIFALEILEHIPAEKHYSFIERCRSLLTTNGKIFLTTPNALDEKDEEYGHIGLLNRKRAKLFIEKYTDYFENSSFIDNKKLLLEPIEFIIEKEASEFEDQSENLSHFRIVMGNESLRIKEESYIEKINNASHRYKIICIAQIYNEMSKRNLERFWKYIQPICDGLVVYDDGSTDGSYEYMLDKAIFTIRAGDNDFENELNHKKILLEQALKLQPDFILRMDADEILTSNAEIELQNICKYADENNIDAINFHEINLWRSHSWKRTDNSYDLGWFVRLWRVTPDIGYNEINRGLHQQDFPHSIKTIEKTDRLSVIHYGFDSDRSLAFKYFVYRSHGQTGWALERLLDESTLSLEKVDENLYPPGLYVDDDKPIKRNFGEALASLENYKEEVFKPRISIVCLIYKSTDWLEFVYEQVLKYTDLSDKEFYFVANDANEEVLRYLDQNYIPYYVWDNSEEQKNEWYINNVYRAWNYAAERAKGDYLLFINSDMAFSENWVENLFNKLNGTNCVASRLVESGKLLSGDHAISKNFGRSVNDFNETSFQEYVKTVSENKLMDSGLFMPLLIRKEHFMEIGGYPEGNGIPGTDIFQTEFAKQGEACVSGDVILMERLKSIGINHTTSYDSVVYHFQCGEMDASESPKSDNDQVRTIISNDYLLGRMGEKTMWGFLLSNLPNSVGVDKDTLNVTENFEKEAGKFIRENYPENSVIIQNATFIDIIENEHFNILYLQDNLRAMGRKSFQQELNLKVADILVTNSKITSASYPEYNFEIIPIGVDDDLFQPLDKKVVRDEFNIPEGRVGIFVGDLSEVKGWEKVKKVIDNHDEIFWIIVSKDNEQYCKKNCKTFNRIEQEKLVKLLNCADFFILGSPVETQCLAAIEACFCNLPLIMRNTGIFADFTEEDRTKLGCFGEDFEKGLLEVSINKYFPREMMFEKKLTIDGMVEKWKTLISRARFFAEQKVLEPTIERPPVFSVVVPTYNQAQYLSEALDSLLAQTYTNWEAIIVNDGSTDNTNEVIEKYLLIDKRFRSFNKENGGVATALNKGVRNIKGEWICWLSSDDFFEPDKLQIHFDEINENPKIKFFYTHWHIFLDETKQKTNPPLWFPIPKDDFRALAFFRGNYISGNSITIHKSVIEKVGYFDERLWQGQDFDMWLKISSEFATKFINKRTMTTRLHASQTTTTFQGGGVFDSTRSLINFINSKKFSQYFPSNYLNDLENIKAAITEIVSIYSNKDSFIFGLGFNVSLIERMGEWLYEECNPIFRDEVEIFIKNKFGTLKSLLNSTNWQLLKNAISKKDVVLKKSDISDFIKHEINISIKEGEQGRAYNLEKYLCNISKREGVVKYSPILFDVKLKEKKSIRIDNVLNWQLSDHTLLTAKHFITYKCDCSISIKVKYDLSLFTENSKGEFVCPECKAHYKFAEKDFFSFINKSLKEPSQKCLAKEISKIIFVTRDSQVIGGGNLIITKYINWLAELGYKVDLISFGLKPDWVKLNANFKSISSIEDLYLPEDENFIVIAGSIWEIPELLRRVNPSNVFLFCQGYEGYHYGKDFLSATSDKSFFDQIHSLPFQVIGVSTHLVELFYSKFNKESYYIPNSINHSIFKQTVKYTEKTNSIVFIGNPTHPLKGFNFLLQAIVNGVNSNLLEERLKLIIITGADDDSRKVREVLDSSGIDDFELHARLSRNEIAEKINESKLLVCASWYEGFSLPVLEAMNCGTPVITTANQGAESFCINEYNSLIVNFGDIQTLFQKIVAVITNRVNVQQLIENGKSTATVFTESASFKRFVNTFSKITHKDLNPKIVDELENKLFNNESTTRKNSSIKQNVLENEHEGKFLFSIIIPTYNRSKALKKALTSISEQTFKNFEVIVINDAGEDVSNILAEFNKTFCYKLITNVTNLERSTSRNEGISLSTGKYILFLDDDDNFYPNHLKTFSKNVTDKTPIIYTDANRAVYYSANGKQMLNTKFVPYSMEFSRKKLLIGNISPINCFCIERGLLLEVGLFTEFINVLEDWELLLRLSQKTKFKHIKKTTCEVSWHSENTTSQKTKEFETIRNWIYKRNGEEIKKISEKEKLKIIQEFNEIWKKDELYNSPLLSIIIPVYNKIEYTKQCVESIERFTKSNYEIIVVDNNSTDETIAVLNNEFSDVKVISNKANLGFPKAINQGILEAKGDYVLIANNDIVVTENWIYRMLEIAKQHPEVGIVGPISNSVSGRQLDKNAKYKTIDEMHKYATKIRKENKGQFFQFPRVAFLCTLIKKEVIDKIGGLDERYSPGNFEDDDFCLRAQMAGYKTVIATDVFIHHYGSVSFKADGDDKYAKRLEINRQKFVNKWGADPEEIWIKGIKPKERGIKYSINSNKFIQYIERTFTNIDENEPQLAIENLEIAVNSFNESEREGFENLELNELLVILGNLYFATNNLEKAKESFEKALNENPNSSAACQGLGEIFETIEEYEPAKMMFEWAVKNDESNNVAKQKLAVLNKSLGLDENDFSLSEE